MSAAPIASHTFAFFTAAAPARVWAALTGAGGTVGYMYGLVACSSWLPGEDIHFETAPSSTAVPSLTGRVLHVQPPCRLSYFLHSAPEDPPVYLTWQVRPCPGGSAVQLRVDGTECPDSDEEAEDTWLPVLAALQASLPNQEPRSPESLVEE
jgi:uncharacterized protein YndB with AHSA1/START domain